MKTPSDDSVKRRAIRSFVLRTGRMTASQQQAYDIGWDRWGLRHESGLLDPEKSFDRSGPLVLEIGFGMGDSLVAMAKAAPASNFIGIEVHTPGVGKLMRGMLDEGLDNIRVYHHDAVEILHDCIPPESLDGVQIFFPDPWHKTRHHKRRLIQPLFVEQLARYLKPGGILHLATDWENYAQQMMQVVSASPSYRNCVGQNTYASRPEHRPLTKFEKRGHRLGHGVWDILFARECEGSN
jgi:tRNA (guanine-N7-)-methyltransferase